MIYSFARIGAVVAMDVEDYFVQGRRMWLRLHEKGGKVHDVPAHHKAEEFLDRYMDAAGLTEQTRTPLFRTVDRHRRLTDRRLSRREALAIVKRRVAAIGLSPALCCHSFRATGITAYLQNGGSLENDQPYCLPSRNLFSLLTA